MKAPARELSFCAPVHIYWLSIFKSSASSITGTPSSRAFVSFEPAASPATT